MFFFFLFNIVFCIINHEPCIIVIFIINHTCHFCGPLSCQHSTHSLLKLYQVHLAMHCYTLALFRENLSSQFWTFALLLAWMLLCIVPHIACLWTLPFSMAIWFRKLSFETGAKRLRKFIFKESFFCVFFPFQWGNTPTTPALPCAIWHMQFSQMNRRFYYDYMHINKKTCSITIYNEPHFSKYNC